MAEMKQFVFVITFIIIFTTMTNTMPTGYLGNGITYDDSTILENIDPSLITGFTDYTNYSYAAFSGIPLAYAYTFNTKYWVCWQYASAFQLASKVMLWGTVWLGQYASVVFTAPDGTDRGTTLTFTEIDADDDNGTVRYTLSYYDNGNAAGHFVIGWNTTAYSSPALAWVADELYVVHGIGIDEAAPANALNLIIGLLTFSLPNVPLLVGLMLGTPIWASVAFLVWFIVKESMPFV